MSQVELSYIGRALDRLKNKQRSEGHTTITNPFELFAAEVPNALMTVVNGLTFLTFNKIESDQFGTVDELTELITLIQNGFANFDKVMAESNHQYMEPSTRRQVNNTLRDSAIALGFEEIPLSIKEDAA